jgi:hypothetical protein
MDGYYANPEASQCLTCETLIERCETCEYQAPYERVQCHSCEEGYEPTDDKYECDKSMTTTIIIAVSVAVAVLLVGGAGKFLLT